MQLLVALSKYGQNHIHILAVMALSRPGPVEHRVAQTWIIDHCESTSGQRILTKGRIALLSPLTAANEFVLI